MTKEEIEVFKREFKSVVYHKGQVSLATHYIRQLSHYDRNGSHSEAIKKYLLLRDEKRKHFAELLKGKTYDEWKVLRSIISKLESRIKNGSEKSKLYALYQLKELINP